MSSYRCDMCGCYLDPGEGLLCDECRDDMRQRSRASERHREAIREAEAGQYEMRLQEA